jgi:hypothetical protein
VKRVFEEGKQRRKEGENVFAAKVAAQMASVKSFKEAASLELLAEMMEEVSRDEFDSNNREELASLARELRNNTCPLQLCKKEKDCCC